MPSFLAFVRDQYTHLPIPDPPANIKEATYIVTGANTGLGYECTKHLFRLEAFAQRVDKLDRLDAIIENAGLVMTKFELVEGIEHSLLVNVVSTMLLAFRVLPKLQESAGRLGVQTHLVIVSSNTAFPCCIMADDPSADTCLLPDTLPPSSWKYMQFANSLRFVPFPTPPL